ncbi:MAG: DUF4335 domain-containing protein [Cyanobium sp.]
MKNRLQYDQQSCRLMLEGLPDLSAGQAGDVVGILTGWSLAWVGRSEELEGRREHLQAILQVVLPYARLLLSGVPKRLGAAGDPAEIAPAPDGGHTLLLRSSQPDVPPLELALDDAELADLVRVLDRLRLDPRLQVELLVPPVRPLRAREVQQRTPLPRRLAGVVGGAATLALAAAAAWSPAPPVPRPQPSTPAAAAARTPPMPPPPPSERGRPRLP